MKATALSLEDGGVLSVADDEGSAGKGGGKNDKDAGKIDTGKADSGKDAGKIDTGKADSGKPAEKCVVADCKEAPAQPIPGVTIPPCCTDDEKCGLDVSTLGMGGGCVEQNAPGDLDSNCPDVSLMGIIDMKGCCRPDSTCGSQDTFLGLGCTFNTEDQNIPCNPGPI